MPDNSRDADLDRELQQLLGYNTVTSDRFVIGVMQRVQRERRRRRLILFSCGAIGAVFGVIGAALLSAPIAGLFTALPATGIMQAALIVGSAAAFYGWIMNEDISLAT